LSTTSSHCESLRHAFRCGAFPPAILDINTDGALREAIEELAALFAACREKQIFDASQQDPLAVY
jgi:hypothetical protein